MRRPGRIGFASVVLLVAGASAFGHVRLRHSGNGSELYWANPHSIRVVISSAGSDDIAPGLHFPAFRNAIAAWNGAPGSRARLAEDATPAQQARSDWEADGIHLLLFDETNASGYFPSGTGIVAITPLWFASDGRITDADVLFNGAGYGFTTSREPGSYDLEDVAAHELGHFLGLDHSGSAGATMHPYVATTSILHRSLSRDDVLGMRDAYPAAGFAAIRGTIRRASDDSVVAGAHVVARDASGRTAGGALASAAGAFEIVGLDAGTYTLFATPLDFPVSAANLGPGHTVAVDFGSTLFGAFAVGTGQTIAVGSQRVDPDVPISLGRNSDRYPLRCIAGQAQSLAVRGSGLAPGSTLAASEPSIDVVATAWLGNAVTFQVTVLAGAEPGHADLTATSPSGERSILVAALEITPEDPTVASVVPDAGSTAGGTALTIEGTGFAPGARVVIGDVVYEDGLPGGCTVVDAGTIELTTAATIEGTHDVVVIDPSGVEGRRIAAFDAATMPRIDSVFPEAGSAAGGTRVVLLGQDFVPGCTVRIDGVAQSQVVVDDATRLSFTTDAGTAGGPYELEVLHPGGSRGTAAFTFAAGADPSIDSVDPARGSTSGGDRVTIRGAEFSPGSEVVFGADADTGTGGDAAAMVTWIDAETLEVITPARPGGSASVLVRDPATGQAFLIDGAFTFASSGGGGGGCSVSTLPSQGSWTPFEPLAGSLWLLLLAAIVLGRALRATRAAETSARA
ncbi:MAG: IPT/TIG domain-containing protein [Planctomycetota bacterium]